MCTLLTISIQTSLCYILCSLIYLCRDGYNFPSTHAFSSTTYVFRGDRVRQFNSHTPLTIRKAIDQYTPNDPSKIGKKRKEINSSSFNAHLIEEKPRLRGNETNNIHDDKDKNVKSKHLKKRFFSLPLLKRETWNNVSVNVGASDSLSRSGEILNSNITSMANNPMINTNNQTINVNKYGSKFSKETPLTMSDLERILNNKDYISRKDVESIYPRQISSKQSQIKTDVQSTTSSTKNSVAFPQPSVVSWVTVKICTIAFSSLFIFLVSVSLQPNLWLIGSSVGAFYGQSITEKVLIQDQPTILGLNDASMISFPGGLYGELCFKAGKKAAEVYLKVFDISQTFWFMYRTGQLSYTYYKKFEVLDARFAINDKVDAWNARFVQGKVNFDKWEKENEVGSKILAGLRTAWLVEENRYVRFFKYV